MPRRLGATVPATVSRLLQGGLINTPPAWYEAVGTVAPLRPSLTRKMPSHPATAAAVASPSSSKGTGAAAAGSPSSEYEWKGSKKLKNATKLLRYRPPKPQPLPGFELYDRVRRMFFKDHPFEAFKGTTLVEFDVLVEEDSKPGPKGLDWTELNQRSTNPSPEDVVDFVVNLHENHKIPLSLAYSSAVSQFRSLRASHEVALQAAQTEMQAYGHEWPTEFSAIDRLSRAEDRNLLEVLKGSNTSSSSSSSSSSSVGEDGQTSTKHSMKGGHLLYPTPTLQRGWTQGTAYLKGNNGKADNGSKA